MSRHRAWCFTINNWTKSDEFAVEILMKKAKYGICGKESGVLETPHLQGYIHLENPLSLLMMKKYLSRANLRVANGTDMENFEYCAKGMQPKSEWELYKSAGENWGKNADFKEWGEKSEGQGQRNDLKEIAALIKSGDITITDLMFEYPNQYVKYSRSFEKMFAAVQKPRENPPEVYWRWGLAGTGKTRYVIDTYKQENVYIKDGTMWWDGYNSQEVILIDDFDNQIPYRTLLRILDRYAYQGQIKGGYVHINSPKIFITCEFHPEHYWKDNELAQVMRRITKIEYVSKSSNDTSVLEEI